MKQLLLFGAGKSATVLIDYLLLQAAKEKWTLTVADANLQLALDKVHGAPAGRAVSFDILDDEKRETHIAAADLVISMLPPALHSKVAKDCVVFAKHLLTASYVDEEIRGLEEEIERKQLLFLCEMGLDPGIDHMSAMKVIDEIHAQNGRITSFRSHCGGLVAPESDDNPWHYKISWNPRNIVLSGKAGAHYRENNREIRADYKELFAVERLVTLPELGSWGWYPNRDSLSYSALYGLNGTATFVRTTLRHPDFMRGWKQLIDLELTDEMPAYETNGKSLAALFQEHFEKKNMRALLAKKISSDECFRSQAVFLGFEDDDTRVDRGRCSAADLLQFALEKKLVLATGDKDMILMLHEFDYEINGKRAHISSSLAVTGEDSLHTAMAKTVGLPLGIAATLILKGVIRATGLRIPTSREIYEPVLKELERHDVRFREER